MNHTSKSKLLYRCRDRQRGALTQHASLSQKVLFINTGKWDRKGVGKRRSGCGVSVKNKKMNRWNLAKLL